jgi:hypothetical protein
MMERRSIDELIGRRRLGSGEWLGVDEVTPNLKVRTPIVRYDVDRRLEKRVQKREKICVKWAQIVKGIYRMINDEIWNFRDFFSSNNKND